MFTGLIEEVGTVGAIANGPAGRELYIRSEYTGLVDGESIAVNGVCLTVREHDDDGFTVGAVETTLGRTTIEDWRVGRQVNLERAMVAGARLGGHIVAGHVDAVGTVRSVEQSGDARLVALALPPEVMDLSVLHGSITVDGVSLTINALPPDGTLQLSLIEYTLRHTTLGNLRAGDTVNVEADLIGKYVQKLMQPYKASS
ncbi:MAG TPA: riboflavin synthase [Gemmatimonadaceae bacterium]|nr:riboflavin synthase [Gemmatimonadaceae bacterium]